MVSHQPGVLPYLVGNFHGGLIFVIFVTALIVTKFSTPQKFTTVGRRGKCSRQDPRNLEPRKLILEAKSYFSQKFIPLKITHYMVVAS